ncbi:hypothetical protein EXIGLDRAFT_436845 [Exidia glandulosa HHB12029]|uniref:Uncharacterized protein n=1 Tax=Exidia glandulosa HHB12029 TaxID=1314781 RepID=A0A165B8A5_EXIGL|nr:hypothetical protein EXIGLDRAFT_436845 [Exidia glandulosa HHB12029]
MTRDGISVPSVAAIDNAACVELLRGVRKRGRVKPNGVVGAISRSSTAFRQGKSSSSSVGSGDELVQDPVSAFGTHCSFVTSPLLNQHDAKMPGSCAYDARNFVERDADVLDPALVSDSCAVAVRGCGWQRQRVPELDPNKVYSVQTQLNTVMSELLGTLDAYVESRVYSVFGLTTLVRRTHSTSELA